MIEAKYTILYKDWLDTVVTYIPQETSYKDLLLAYFGDAYDDVDGESLVNMLSNVFRYYEIGSDDDDEMLMFMKDTFDEYGDYYSELISNYKKEYDYALNNKRVITKSDELHMVGNTEIKNKSDGSNTEYALPNKVIDDDYRSTPSGITDNKSSSENNKDYNNDTTRDTKTTTDFNNEFIDLKNKYLNQIRNVYREFAMKFKDCFYQIY